MNSLPDLSTVDIQAIQDTEPILPRFQLPPLMTIAENWQDTINIKLPTRNSCHNSGGNDSVARLFPKEGDCEEEEDRTHKVSPKVMNQHLKALPSRRPRTCSSSSGSSGSSSSSSGANDSGTDCSDSEGSDSSATSDSEEGSSSSTSGSDDDSDSSSASSVCSNRGLLAASIQSGQPSVSNDQEKAAFSIREANYDQGRVTLRLSSLQLSRIADNDTTDNEEPIRSATGRSPVKQAVRKSPSKAASSRRSSPPAHQTDRKSCLPQSTSAASRKIVTPIKLRRKSSPKPAPATLAPTASLATSDQSKASQSADVRDTTPSHSRRSISASGSSSSGALGKSKSAKAESSGKAAQDVGITGKSRTGKRRASGEKPLAISNPSTLVPSRSTVAAKSEATITSSMLSDLDSDSDESYLPAVSEAIRMLDLDSQGSCAAAEPTAAQAPSSSSKSGNSSSNQNSSGMGSGRLLNLCPGSSASIAGSSWQAVGYCSSLLQQFVAKSQSGEPPPPPPVQLTKGARKCFMDEPFHGAIGVSVSAVASATSSAAASEKTKGTAEQDNLCDVLLPMRGLDCHPSHVSPDSGIQSVSGSPFSVHSSPVHPGAHGNGSSGGQSLAQAAQQQHTLTISPCPPVATPSPPPPKDRRSRTSKAKTSVSLPSKSTATDATAATAASVKSSRSNSRSRSSHRSKSQSKSKSKDKAKSKNKSKGSKHDHGSKSITRRPRSCRDTASALSSGLGKDSSFVQAIQRGLNDALRLTGLHSGSTENEEHSGAAAPAIDGAKALDKSKSRREGASAEGSHRSSRESKKDRSRNKNRADHQKATAPSPSVPTAASTATEKDASTFRNEIAAQLHLLINRGATLGGSEVKSANTVKALVEAPVSLAYHPPVREKRKKKKKKHKKETGDRVTSPAFVSPPALDPIVQQGLDLLCKTLSRCAISRNSTASALSGSRLPCIFQCRKYLGVVSGSKRKKVDDDSASSVPPVNKRKNKSKRTDSSNGLGLGGSSSNSGEKDATDSKNLAAGAAAAAGVSGELLLPLKKRHHHLPAPESASASHQAAAGTSAATTDPLDSNGVAADGRKDPKSEKTSHEPVLSPPSSAAHSSTQQLPPQPSHSRKRTAAPSNDSANDTSTESVAGDSGRQSHTGKSRRKKMRGRKKAAHDPPTAPEAAKSVETKKSILADPTPALPKSHPPAAELPVETVVARTSSIAKKARRRKSFNRTGFPNVKKKRKKLSPTPVPDGPQLVPEVPVPEPVKTPKSSESSAARPGRAKRPRLHAPVVAAKDDDSDIALPESVPTTRTTTTSAGSSESPSGDEMVSAKATKAAADAAGAEGQPEPKKRQKRVPSWRKRYLTAGLFSHFFKQDDSSSTSSGAQGPPSNTPAPSRVLTYDPDEHEHGLLPPPFHCEKWLRRRRNDFQLPYDLWWLHQHGKLPGRDTMVPSWNYRKIRTNVYYDVKPPYSNDAQACNCKAPPPNADGSIQADAYCGDDCLNRMVYTECSNQLCPLADKCCNQRIQRHMWAQGLERFMTNEKGWGVRCRNPIKAGQFILEYVGEVVSEREFKERMNTVYTKDTHHYCLHLDGGLVIDGHRMGGDGRFVNHSCAPNCEMQKWSVNGLPRMALFALRDIGPNEELSYDYNFSLFNPAEGQPCKCGSAQCRGVIGGKSQRVNVNNVVQDNSKNRAKSQQQQQQQQQKRKRKRQQQDGKAGGATSSALTHLAANLKPLSSQQRSFVMQRRCFLVRNLERVRRCRDREKDRIRLAQNQQQQAGRSRRFLQKIAQAEAPAPAAPPAVPTPAPVLPAAAVPVSSPEKSHHQPASQVPPLPVDDDYGDEEVVRCRCRLFDDEGLMVQCERCETWQHSDCLGPEKAKAALADDHYICDTCTGYKFQAQDLDIVLQPQPDNPPEGTTFYLSMHYKDLQVRQGDCVYVLRDHDTPDSKRILWQDAKSGNDGPAPTPRPPRLTSGRVKVSDLDIFQVERMWVDETGKKFVYGHHYLRPHETFHEPSRKFYVNEVLHVPIYEQIPVWAVAGRCWVLDPTTFCKGRPADAVEEHVYICEHRVDKTARLFAKVARNKFPLCTKRFAFKSFPNRLKPQRTYQPHPQPTSRTGPGSSVRTKEAAPVAPAAVAPPVDKKLDRKRREHKMKEAETLPVAVTKPAPLKSERQKATEQRQRLNNLLCSLLRKNESAEAEVEDASYLLERRESKETPAARGVASGRGRGRGRGRRRKGT